MLRSRMPAPVEAFLYRVFVTIHRAVRRTDRFLSELPVVLYSPSLERCAVDTHYDDSPQFRDNVEHGLFRFEERALERFFPKPPARLALPGAGGGRELL